MNKFNRPRGNAVKQRKINKRSAKKRSHVKAKDAVNKLKVAGQRTGLLSNCDTLRQEMGVRSALGNVDTAVLDYLPAVKYYLQDCIS
jgi:hypothetical protein